MIKPFQEIGHLIAAGNVFNALRFQTFEGARYFADAVFGPDDAPIRTDIWQHDFAKTGSDDEHKAWIIEIKPLEDAPEPEVWDEPLYVALAISGV